MFSIEDIVSATGGTLVQGPSTLNVRRVIIDSRILKKGDVFVAIKGDRFDGHTFLQQVADAGAKVCIVSRWPRHIRFDGSVIRVKDTAKALGDLAALHRNRFAIPVIAITGSVGKTTVKEMIAAVLQTRYRVLKSPSSFNNYIGVPLTLLQLKPSHEAAVIECGTNQPGDIRYVARIARPTVAVFTRFGPTHLEGLKTVQGVFKEKIRLLDYLDGAVVANTDDPLGAKVLQKVKPKQRISYAVRKKALFQAQRITLDHNKSISFQVGRQRYSIPSPNMSYVSNALAAVACGSHLGVRPRDAAAALSKMVLPPGRMTIRTKRGITFLDDAYNANPLSFESALETLAHLKTKKKRWVVAGDMLELGKTSRHWHEQVGRQCAGCGIDGIITLGTQARLMGRAAQAVGVAHVHARAHEDVVAHLRKVLNRGDVVLVKGSRGMRLEKVIAAFISS